MWKCRRLLKKRSLSCLSMSLLLIGTAYKIIHENKIFVRRTRMALNRNAENRTDESMVATAGSVIESLIATLRQDTNPISHDHGPALLVQLTKQTSVAKFSTKLSSKIQVQVCGDNDEKSWTDDLQLIAVPNRRLVVCYVQKAGSTTWQKLVYRMRHPDKPWQISGHSENRMYARNIDTKTKSLLLTDPLATRVICVRHPFSRLISGWNNKFHKRFIDRSGSSMENSMPGITEYFAKASTTDRDHVLSFRDFVQYIVDHGLEQVDNHFRSIQQLCQPCSFPYDFVVKAESAPEDLWWVLRRFNGNMDSFPVHSTSEFGGMKNFYTRTGLKSMEKPYHQLNKDYIVETIRERFQNIPRPLVKKLMDMYRNDFEYFGYTYDCDTATPGGFT